MMFFKNWQVKSVLERLLQQHLPMLERIVASYEAIPAIQQELMQEVVLAIWTSYKNFKGDASVKTYFARIAHNRCISHVDKAVRQVSITIPDTLDEHYQDNVEHLSSSEKYEHLLKQIRQLPLLQKQVISLFLEGFSYNEIADVCGLTTTNVGVMLNRLKSKLAIYFLEETS